MAYCPKCSAEVPDGASFCTNCGAQIIISPQQQPIAPVEPAPAAEPPVREEPAPVLVEEPKPVKKKKTWLIWLIVGLVVVGRADVDGQLQGTLWSFRKSLSASFAKTCCMRWPSFLCSFLMELFS